ncbi:hypothetical protein JAAARDRAFT_61118 [Jaapia argillacea MUCL 33604]|uniref:Uncharacterized protein n=1 Tax=Jaapia argillacea MUCL 33604 TaxID=933084 RepID=A0A067PFP3_9AGAM|nr:hypothetical protein JAAARDRAFT_61118 [Jaapia argillacea MUCL 33604]
MIRPPTPEDYDPSSAIPLPPELYSHIFSLIPCKRQLHRLCLASSSFYHEAVPFLYHTVDLATSKTRTISFGSTITSNPKLGLHVRNLTIRCWSHPSYECVRDAFEALYRQILLTVDNLQVLTIAETHIRFKDFNALVRHCRFTLDAFHNMSLGLDAIDEFLLCQPRIRHWTHLSQCQCTIGSADLTLHSQVLPNLTIMETDLQLVNSFDAPHPVREMYLRYGIRDNLFERPALVKLKLFTETLVTLKLDRNCIVLDGHGLADFSGLDILQHVAESVPGLRNLWIQDSHFWKVALDGELDSPDTNAALILLSKYLARFAKLETFAYSPHPSDSTSFWWSICEDKGPDYVAQVLFSPNSPSLRTLLFPVEPVPVSSYSAVLAVRYLRSPIGDHRKHSSALFNFGPQGEQW